MNIRESMEQRELELLSPYAAHTVVIPKAENGRRKNVMSAQSIRETGTEFCTVRHFGE